MSQISQLGTYNISALTVADVYVQKVGDDYVVTANDEGMPKLKISGYYQSAMKGDPSAKEYIQTKLRSAQWLNRSANRSSSALFHTMMSASPASS